jgi:hypothetical protein
LEKSAFRIGRLGKHVTVTDGKESLPLLFVLVKDGLVDSFDGERGDI